MDRGGSWGGDASRGRASLRNGDAPGNRYEIHGYRLARIVPSPP
jgi:hypothetical protein